LLEGNLAALKTYFCPPKYLRRRNMFPAEQIAGIGNMVIDGGIQK
jgi:hypothetical protein